MEIGDIFVVNKADRESADRTAQEIHSMIMMSEPVKGWRPRVLKIIATSGDGVTGLVEAIKQHSNYLKDSKGQRRTEASRMRSEVLDAAKRYFEDISLREMTSSKMFGKIMNQVEARKMDPYTAGCKLVAKRR